MLEASNLSFAYNAGRPDAIVALRDVSLRVQPGEMVAVIGHNGSGKSTLAKLLCAMLTPTGGSVVVDGLPATPEHVWEIRRRVGMVFQRPDDQLVANTVIDDVAFGPENLGLPREEIERRVRDSLAALGIGRLTHAQVSELSGGEKQLVAIAGVLAMNPAYLILDEPTTMIAPPMVRRLIALAHELREQAGVGVVHITHFMPEVVGFDRVVVMDGGRVLMEGAPREVFGRADELGAAGLATPEVTRLGRNLRARGVPLPEVVLTAEELAEALRANAERHTLNAEEEGVRSVVPPSSGAAPSSSSAHSSPLLEARGLSFAYMAGTPLEQEALRDVSCAVYEGEVLALLGGPHAGKSTLVEFFNGLRTPAPGHVFYEGQDVAAPAFDIGRLRDEVGLVFQQPEAQLFEDTVGKDVSFVPRRRRLPPAESRAIVERVLTEVGLDYETFRLRYVYALSGGQKRRVAIAGVLAAEPRVLVLDEPVAGLDPRGRAELAELVAGLVRRLGLTVVLVGNAVDELAELATRALVLHEGRVVMEGPLRELLRCADELHAVGVELGQPAEIALVLRGVLPDLPTDVLTVEELEEALLQWRLSSHVT
ncbi:MAG: hypothetical protein RLZZ387_4209 [Chloroflexota bacterium]|jgi:energy-coupling factor transport system ATP-binding protein